MFNNEGLKSLHESCHAVIANHHSFTIDALTIIATKEYQAAAIIKYGQKIDHLLKNPPPKSQIKKSYLDDTMNKAIQVLLAPSLYLPIHKKSFKADSKDFYPDYAQADKIATFVYDCRSRTVPSILCDAIFHCALLLDNSAIQNSIERLSAILEQKKTMEKKILNVISIIILK